MTDLSARFPLFIEDEYELLQQLAPARGADILDVGCGAALFTGRMASEGGARRVVGLEVDEVQMSANLAKTWPANVEFTREGAQAIPYADASFDGVTLFKSLHHIPGELLAQAFRELHRVLKPGGWAYISEPVADGPYNDVMRIFHDEAHVRTVAIEAMQDALAAGLFRRQRQVRFFAPITYRDFDDFRERMMKRSYNEVSDAPELVETVRRAYDVHQSPRGATFNRPMRVDLLIREG